jgi:hypothetical protein
VIRFGRGSIVALGAACGMLSGIAGGVVACGAFDEGAGDVRSSADADADTTASMDGSGLGDSPVSDAPAADACADCATVIATSSREIHWVALDATRVLWMDSLPQGGGPGDLRACPRTGCAASGPTTIFQASTGAFLTSDGTLAFASISNGTGYGVHRLNADGTTTMAFAQGNTHWLALRDNTLYMTLYGGSLERTISTLAAQTLTLGALANNCHFPGDGLTNTDWTVVGAERIFLGTHSTGGIFACPRDGGDFTYFLQGATDDRWVWGMATDDVNLFWVDLVDRLNSCPVTGDTCTSTTTVLPASSPNYLGGIRTVIHSNGDLLMETSGGDLIGCKATSCPGTVKVLTHENAFAESWRIAGSNVTADDKYIYYVARDGDLDAGATYRLMRLPRKPL